MRKVTELATGQVKDERIYLGGFEIYRRQRRRIRWSARRCTSWTTSSASPWWRRAPQGNEPGVPPQLIRYQFGNHLGSASLELDDQAQIISYEEYTPYGSTSYQAVRSQTETPKRYRYTGKERDEETGFTYHGARYYAPWLGRWVSCDPAGMVDGTNLYEYARAKPVMFLDPTGTTTVESEFAAAAEQRALLERDRISAHDKLVDAELRVSHHEHKLSTLEWEKHRNLVSDEKYASKLPQVQHNLDQAKENLGKAQGNLKDVQAKLDTVNKTFGTLQKKAAAKGLPILEIQQKAEEKVLASEIDKDALKKGGPKGGGGGGGGGGGAPPPPQGGAPAQGNQGGAPSQGGQSKKPEVDSKSSMGGELMGAAGALALSNDIMTFFTGKDSLKFFEDVVRGGFGDPEARTRVGDNIFRVTPADHRAAADARLKREMEGYYQEAAEKQGISVEELKRRIKAQPKSNEGPSIGPGR